MTSTPALKQLVADAASGTIVTTKLAELIRISRSVAEAYLQHQRTSIAHICSFHGITVNDLATDCIAELFARDEQGRFTQIQKFLQSLDGPLESTSELDMFLAFKGLIKKLVNAQLARSYAQIDPAGAKIHRNIKDYLRNAKTLCLREDFRGYTLVPAERDPLDELDAFPMDELERELSVVSSATADIPQMLQSLAQLLTQQSAYRRSVPLIDLVQVFKNIFRRDSVDEKRDVSEIDLTHLNDSDLIPLRRRVLETVNEKIVTSYLLKRKINREEAQILSRAMDSIITDWFEEGQSTNSYIEQVRSFRAMTEVEYNTFWRKRIEYLARVARETVKNYFDENL